MTTMPLGLLRTLQQAPPDEAWRALFEWAWETCRPKILIADAANETSRRDSVLAPADLFLATAGWDLWTQYHASAPRIAERLAVWWRGRAPGRAEATAPPIGVTPCILPKPQAPNCQRIRRHSHRLSASASARRWRTTAGAIRTSSPTHERIAWIFRGGNAST